jgi:hypothetical protein
MIFFLRNDIKTLENLERTEELFGQWIEIDQRMRLLEKDKCLVTWHNANNQNVSVRLR